ncbi:hypothetical protein [Streptomyces ehimensis]|uniref:Uncharacterized protein n=1 Tax=Streptomyces ehimensis TaxID=68195 RepID=A0ABV9BVM8_9ACTN
MANSKKLIEFEDPDEVRAACWAAGGCAVCEERRSWFDGLLDGVDRRWHRLQRPDEYPFTSGQQGIHETTCSVVKQRTPAQYARPTGDAYREALHAFSHTVDPHSDRSDFEGANAYLRFNAMTAEEARSWITERTGPRGGRNYVRCKKCAPAI